MINKIKKSYSLLFLVPFLFNTISCSKKTNNNEEEKEIIQEEKNYYSLKINTNIKDVSNYSVNVDNLNKIEENKVVTIQSTGGFYKIVQFLSSDNELLSSNDYYSFNIKNNTEITIIYTKSDKYVFPSTDNNEANIILMAGQSNMVGTDADYTSLDKTTLNEYRSGHDNVLINYHSNSSYTFNNELSSNFTSVNFGQGNNDRVCGPEVGLSKYLGTNSKDNKYYLVKVAWGGTNLHTQWNPSYYDTENANSISNYMYGKFIRYVDNVLNMFNTKTNLKPKIKCMCWFQGESDTDSTDTVASNYGVNFNNLITAIKAKYSTYIDSDFKWISALISDKYGVQPTATQTEEKKIRIDLVNNGIKTYSDKYIKETENQLEKINKYHYTAKAQLTIGELYGKLFSEK